MRARFVIARNGWVPNVASGGTTLSHGQVVECILQSFTLTFPQPDGGIVTAELSLILGSG